MELHVAFVLLEGLLAVAVVGTNLLVCATLCLHRHLRSTTNCLVGCLALADLGVGVLAVPFSVVLSMDLSLCFYTCLLLACLPLATTQFSVLLLLLIALNTHLKVRLPRSYAMYVRRRRVLGAVGLCWLLSLLIGLSPMMGWNHQRQYVEGNRSQALSLAMERAPLVLIARDQPYGGFLSKVFPGTRWAPQAWPQDPHLGRCSFTSVFTPEYLVYFIFFTCTLLPLGALLGLYAHLFRLVRGHLQAGAGAAKRRDLPMVRTLLLLLSSFCVCWMPLHVLSCVQLLCPGCRRSEALSCLAVLLSHLNSLANPLVYALRKRELGRAVRAVFLRYVLCCRRAKVHPQGQPPPAPGLQPAGRRPGCCPAPGAAGKEKGASLGKCPHLQCPQRWASSASASLGSLSLKQGPDPGQGNAPAMDGCGVASPCNGDTQMERAGRQGELPAARGAIIERAISGIKGTAGREITDSAAGQ